MSDTTLHDLVLARLEKDTQPEDEWSALVLAALDGPEPLRSLLEEPKTSSPPESPSDDTPAKARAGHASPAVGFLRSVSVEGFCQRSMSLRGTRA